MSHNQSESSSGEPYRLRKHKDTRYCLNHIISNKLLIVSNYANASYPLKLRPSTLKWRHWLELFVSLFWWSCRSRTSIFLSSFFWKLFLWLIFAPSNSYFPFSHMEWWKSSTKKKEQVERRSDEKSARAKKAERLCFFRPMGKRRVNEPTWSHGQVFIATG